MRRRKSAREKRIAKRRRQLMAKEILKFSVPIAAIITILTMYGTSIVNFFKGMEIFNHKNYDEYYDPSIEETLETPSPEPTPEILETPEPTPEVVEESVVEESIPEETTPEEPDPEEIVPEEVIGTDLLDMGFEFYPDVYSQIEEKFNINQDTMGWIYLEGTKVDYPIMHGIDNDYYIHHDVDGTYIKNVGCIYLDANNYTFVQPIDGLDDLNFIYGHHITGGGMFSTICKYKEQAFYEEYPFYVIYTKDGLAYKADVFAGVLWKGSDNSIYNDNYNFDDEQDFIDYMDYLKENSLISSDLSVEYGDKIVALVTCSYENGLNGNLRFALFARLSKQYTNELQREEGAHLGLHN